MDTHDTLALQIAFSQAKGIYGSTARELLSRIGGLDSFFDFSQAELHNLSGVGASHFADDYRRGLLDVGVKEAAIIREKNIDALILDGEGYPARLANCEDAPLVLYRYGSCDLNKGITVGVVGTRHATPYGVDFTTRLVSDLAAKVPGIVVISGLAYGIDVAAHKAAINAGVPTVGVLAHGLSRIYPAAHRQVAARMAQSGGALVSEYLYGTSPQKGFFLARNRIIAGLCDCVIVVESDFRGGAMSTARVAMNYNRDVFAVPGRVNDQYSQGTNALIANHTASLIQNADDVIALMGWEVEPSQPAEAPALFRALSAEEQEILDFITANPDMTINDLCVRLGKSYSTVSALIFALEIDDIIITLPGGKFAPTVRPT